MKISPSWSLAWTARGQKVQNLSDLSIPTTYYCTTQSMNICLKGSFTLSAPPITALTRINLYLQRRHQHTSAEYHSSHCNWESMSKEANKLVPMVCNLLFSTAVFRRQEYLPSRIIYTDRHWLPSHLFTLSGSNGAFTLYDTKTNIEVDKLWLV